MNKAALLFLLGALFPAALPLLASAQEELPGAPQSQEPLRVFLDCDDRTCDSDHFRREVEFISYVRDRMDAQLHVLVTSQATGAGGEEYSFFFIGLRDWEGAQDTLRYVSRPDETDDETRSGLVQTFKLGLVRYVAPTPVGRQLGITYGGRREEAAVGPPDDPWDLWVFRISVGGEIEGESQEDSKSFDGSITASRTTEGARNGLRVLGGSGIQLHLRLRLQQRGEPPDVHRRQGETGQALTGRIGHGRTGSYRNV
jgi:hypothetical protein